MDNHTNQNNRYFQDALSDFIYDAASGRAIRHLAGTGYTTAQIMKELGYPTPFAKVQHTVTQYLIETGILLEDLPVSSAGMQAIQLDYMPPEGLFTFLARQVRSNGEENSYMSCPFGMAGNSAGGRIQQALSMLTAREREYLEGIAWQPKIMYHRLNRRMLEIGAQTAVYSVETRFYFFGSREVFTSTPASSPPVSGKSCFP